jgi:hypothetical protein
VSAGWSPEDAAPQVPAPGRSVEARWNELLGRFRQAKSLVAVCRRSLAAQELAEAGDEEVGLQHALQRLQQAYDAFDALSPSGLSGDRAPTAESAESLDRCAAAQPLQEAISLVVVCRRSLSAQAVPEAGEEDLALQLGIRLLQRVYDELDAFEGPSPKPRAAPRRRPRRPRVKR